MSNSKQQIYDMVQGDSFFLQLVEKFYSKVSQDDILKGMFHNSFEEPKRNLYLFLRKIFGGPDDYTPLRGHPMMRKRHLLFPIGLQERNRWVKLMLSSLDDLGISVGHPARPAMEEYFQDVATHLLNKPVTADDINTVGRMS